MTLTCTRIDVRKADPAAMRKAGWSYGDIDRARNRKARVYIFPKGETVLDNLTNRWARPATVYKKEVIPHVLTAMGLAADTKVRWSQKAGCSCGCSPGFIIDSVIGTEVFVDIESVEVLEKNP